MRELILKLPRDDSPIYLRIMIAIRDAIESSQITSGERLPAIRELAQRLAVSRQTVARALDELVAEGWLEARPRSGFFVSRTLPSGYVARQRRPVPAEVRPGRRLQWQSKFDADRIPAPYDWYVPPPGGISLENSGPDLRLLPVAELRRSISLAMRGDPFAVFGYGNAAGYRRFVDAVTEYLRHMCGITGREVIITNSSMEACLLVCRLLLGPGKVVAMEELCFLPIMNQFRIAGTEILPLPLDEAGVIPEALEEHVRQRKIDLIYLTPLHQYPTTATLPAQRRARIYEIASEHDIPILEDDYDHEFHYRSQPPAPLASDDPMGLVIYASTFSKSLFPSAKLGFLAVPHEIYRPLLSVRRATSFHAGNFLQAALAYWFEGGGFERHVKRMRAIYEKRMLHASERLDALVRKDPSLRFRRPEGGLALWLDTGRDAAAVARQGREHGVGVNPEEACHVLGRRGGTHVRICFGCRTPEELDLGVDLLEKALNLVPRA